MIKIGNYEIRDWESYSYYQDEIYLEIYIERYISDTKNQCCSGSIIINKPYSDTMYHLKISDVLQYQSYDKEFETIEQAKDYVDSLLEKLAKMKAFL